jgi:predicted ATP-dependent protease
LAEVPKRILKGLRIIPVATIDEAIPHVFGGPTAKKQRKSTRS